MGVTHDFAGICTCICICICDLCMCRAEISSAWSIAFGGQWDCVAKCSAVLQQGERYEEEVDALQLLKVTCVCICNCNFKLLQFSIANLKGKTRPRLLLLPPLQLVCVMQRELTGLLTTSLGFEWFTCVCSRCCWIMSADTVVVPSLMHIKKKKSTIRNYNGDGVIVVFCGASLTDFGQQSHVDVNQKR